MIALDEDALICDYAETYHILNYRELPVKTMATLAVGLGMNSRIMRKIRGDKASLEIMLMMSIVDRLSILIWQQTEDGRQGINMPASLLENLLMEKSSEIVSFDSIEDFNSLRQEIIEEVERNGG